MKNAEGDLKRTIDHLVINEYRGAISALNSGAPVMFTKADSPLGRSFHNFARAIEKQPRPVTGTAVVVPAR